MKNYVPYLVLAVIGTLGYHIGQKALPQTHNPMLLLAGMYGVAFLICAAMAPLFGTLDVPGLLSTARLWPVLLIAIAVVAVEGGFLFAYRYDAPLSWSAGAVNGLSAALLVFVALVFHRENFTATQGFGMAAVCLGLVLLRE